MNIKFSILLALFLFGFCLSQETNLRITQQTAQNHTVGQYIEGVQINQESEKCLKEALTECRKAFLCALKLLSLKTCSEKKCNIKDEKAFKTNQNLQCINNSCRTQLNNIEKSQPKVNQCLQDFNNNKDLANQGNVEEEKKEVFAEKNNEEDKVEIVEKNNEEDKVEVAEEEKQEVAEDNYEEEQEDKIEKNEQKKEQKEEKQTNQNEANEDQESTEIVEGAEKNSNSFSSLISIILIGLNLILF